VKRKAGDRRKKMTLGKNWHKAEINMMERWLFF